MTAEKLAANRDTALNETVGDLFEVVAKVEEKELGVFDAPLNRGIARALAEAGYSLKPNTQTKTSVNELFDIIITVEHESKGVFRATLARHSAQALVKAGCSR